MTPRLPQGLLAVLLACMLAAAAPAAPLTAARDLYAAGHYREAADAAARQDDAASDALAARALLAAALVRPRGEAAKLVDAAIEAARRAVARDPSYVEGHVQLAVALGFQGRMIGNITAHEHGLPAAAREAIDAALSLAPDDPWALSFDGTWHLEILDGAGPMLAAALYGASRGRGLASLRAAAAAPDASPIVLHQCALQVLAHDPRTFADQAERWLVAAKARGGRDAFERHTIRQADRLLRALRSGRESFLRHEIERQQRR